MCLHASIVLCLSMSLFMTLNIGSQHLSEWYALHLPQAAGHSFH